MLPHDPTMLDATCRSHGYVGRTVVAQELQYEPVLALASRPPTAPESAKFWREKTPMSLFSDGTSATQDGA